jgi:hypothetical protein
MPRLPAPTRAPATQGGLVPLGVPESIGNAVASLGETIADIGFEQQAQDNRIRRSNLYTEKTTELFTELDRLKTEARETEDIDGIGDTYAARVQAVVQEIGGSFDDEIVGAEFDNFSTKHVAAAAIDVDEIQRSRQRDRAVSELPEQVKTIQDSMANASSDVVREFLATEGRQMIALNLGNVGVSSTAIEKAVAGFDRQNNLNDFARIIENDAVFALEITSDSEKFQEALPHLNESDRIVLRDKSASEVEAQSRALGEKVLSDINIASGRANSMFELGNLERDVEALWAQERISGPQRTSAVKAIDARRAALQTETNLLADFDHMMNGGITDPTSKRARDAVEAGYQSLVQGREMPFDEQIAIGNDVIERTGVVPKQVISYLNAISHSDNAALLEAAAGQYAFARSERPMAISQIAEPRRMVLENVSAALPIGISAKDVASQSRETLRLNESTRKQREDEYRTIQTEETDREWLDKNLGTLSKGVPDTFYGPFSNAVKRRYVANPLGGIQLARENTLLEARRTVGFTNVGARTRFMAYPPETQESLSGFSNDSEAIQEQLDEVVIENLSAVSSAIRSQTAKSNPFFEALSFIGDFAEFTPPNRSSGIEPLSPEQRQENHEAFKEYRKKSGKGREIERILDRSMILSDRETRRSAREGVPTYPVFLLSDTDELIPLADDSGAPVRFAPDFESSPAGIRQAEENQAIRAERAARMEANARADALVLPGVGAIPVTREFPGASLSTSDLLRVNEQ